MNSAIIFFSFSYTVLGCIKLGIVWLKSSLVVQMVWNPFPAEFEIVEDYRIEQNYMYTNIF